MHDIDRTFMEYDPESESSEYLQSEFDESEWTRESGEVFDDNELMELASELMEVSSDDELNYFLGNLIRKASKAIGKVVKSPVGKALGGILKSAARKALPMVGDAIGGYLGGSTGAKVGSQLASRAGNLFGLETEGLSGEDEAFEIAKQYIRFAGNAVKNATAAHGGNPNTIAKAAVSKAAQRHAPGLLRTQAPAHYGGTAVIRSPGSVRSGRWVRRGNRIVLYGA
jgi:uncharacterized protein (DUF697 family)